MGRKSNAKKAERAKQKKNTKAPKVKKQRKSIKESIQNQKTNILSGAFTLIMLAILVSVGFLLFQKAFRATPIAKFLPAEQTIAFVDLNINFDHSQIIKAFNLLESQPLLSKKNIITFAEASTGLNYKSDIQPWLGRQSGLAILNSKNSEAGISNILFAEVQSKTALKNFLLSQNAASNVYEGITTYNVDASYYAASIDDYIFIARTETEIYEFIDLQNRKIDKLYSSNNYRRIDDNLPLNKIAYLYINFEQVTDSLFQNFNLLSEEGYSMDNLGPFLDVFQSEGVALIAMDSNFSIHSFLSLNADIVEDIQNMTFQKKYTASQAELISEDALIFWGGEDLSQQITRLIEVLSGNESEMLVLLNSVIDTYVKKYFGSETEFYQDILPLFNNEFSYSLEPQESDALYHHKFIFELNSPQENKVTIYELANNFATLGAIFEPKIIQRTLDDGTVAKELVAIPEEISKEESEYEGSTIYTLTMGQQGWSVSYAIVDTLAILSTSEESVKSSLDLLNGGGKSLKNSTSFIQQVEPVLKSSDEVSYFKVSSLSEIFFDSSPYSPIFQAIDSFSSGRNYFNDGVVTTNYLKVK